MQEIVSMRGFLFGVTLVLAIGLPLLAYIIGHFWQQIRRDAMATQLKHEMLERGMSAHEIKTVLEAGQDGPLGGQLGELFHSPSKRTC